MSISKQNVALLGCLLAGFISFANAADRSHPDAVKVMPTDELGPLYTNSDGFTLYTWAKDDIKNESKCNGERHAAIVGQGQNPGYLPDAESRPSCEEAWPPLVADDADNPVGAWDIFSRHDGTRQWSYKGKPVYLSSYDSKSGAITGIANTFLFGRAPLFAELDLPIGMAGRMTKRGYTLTNNEGLTVYAKSEGAQCDGECAEAWQPVMAPAVLEEPGDGWSVHELGDGRRQWLKDGQALYTFRSDLQPGDITGADTEGFAPVILYAPVGMPADITTQVTSEGPVFADGNGNTLYVWTCFDESPDALPCDTAGTSQVYRLSICGGPAKCIETWQPVVASEGAKEIGNTWTIIPVDPTGEYQYAPVDPDIEPLMVWAYRGHPVYTYQGDKQPGDIVGHGMRSFVRWGFKLVSSDLSR